jgi:hypothetical protein
MAPLLKHWSFPRKRESSPAAAHFQWLAEWIPAFAGMTALGAPASHKLQHCPAVIDRRYNKLAEQ